MSMDLLQHIKSKMVFLVWLSNRQKSSLLHLQIYLNINIPKSTEFYIYSQTDGQEGAALVFCKAYSHEN